GAVETVLFEDVHDQRHAVLAGTNPAENRALRSDGPPGGILPGATQGRFRIHGNEDIHHRTLSEMLALQGEGACDAAAKILEGLWHERRQGRMTVPQAVDHVQHGLETTVGQNFRKAPLHAAQPGVMAELGFPAAFETGLAGIELPGLEIIPHGLAVIAPQTAHRPARISHRQETQITTAAEGQVPSSEAHGGHGDLKDFQAGGERESLDKAREFRETVKIMTNRENAGIVEKSFLRENVEGPEAVAHNREGGSTIADDLYAGSVLDEPARAAQIFAKFLRTQREDA